MPRKFSKQISVAEFLSTLHKKRSFPLRFSSVNVTKSLMENFFFCAVQVKVLFSRFTVILLMILKLMIIRNFPELHL